MSYADLQGALDRQLARAQATVLYGAQVQDVRLDVNAATVGYLKDGAAHSIVAKLVVLADGGSNVAKIPGIRVVDKDYRQSALVGIVTTDQPHGGIAYERFTPLGPAALLPKGDGFSLVWTAPPETVESLLGLDESAFLSQLNEHFGCRAGKFLSIAHRAAFPLRLRYATPRVARRVAVIGAAAQALHPVAGQGFNLGVRDAADLAHLLASRAEEDIGAEDLLRRYASERRADVRMGIGFTDSLVRVFSTANPLLSFGRGFGLALLDIVPPARRLLAEKMVFGA
jgi:2-octaprenyl-6-methoxyphenol hydroxylase